MPSDNIRVVRECVEGGIIICRRLSQARRVRWLSCGSVGGGPRRIALVTFFEPGAFVPVLSGLDSCKFESR